MKLKQIPKTTEKAMQKERKELKKRDSLDECICPIGLVVFVYNVKLW